MDDPSKTSSSNEPHRNIECRSEKTKVRSLLSGNQMLRYQYNLYQEFKPYLLELDQLKMYGFPLESSDHPGRIVPDPNLIKGSTLRVCCRCGKLFNVLADKSDSCCRYHPSKKSHHNNSFPCCNGIYKSAGCVTWQYHVSTESFLHDVDFVKTTSKRRRKGVNAFTIFALDCEMVFTVAGMEVAKVGIVGTDGSTVYESFVLPQNPVLDYNTRYSGVSEKDLQGVQTTLVDVQRFLLKILSKNSILVGHGLENDLKALRLIHEKVVDTSVVFPLPYSKVYKKSLKALAQEFLNKQIQGSVNGHNCIEDAKTCMELMMFKIHTDLDRRLPFTREQMMSFLPSRVTPDLPVQNYYTAHRWDCCYYTNYFAY